MSLRISALSKRFTGAQQDHAALSEVSFAVPTGAFVTLLGPSGCGKSTLLNLIAGLDRPSAGKIEIEGRLVCDAPGKVFVPPGERNISMVFQSYAIWPHMTVRENVEFPLKHGRKKSGGASERNEAVTRALGKVRLGALEHRPAPLLSGGQQQRVALARALAQNPSLILLDEPLSNLDAGLREQMQKEIRGIVSDEGITAVYVTHDQKEALSMSDVVIVMKDGRVEQIGAPRDIYYRPANRFVAQFMGSPNLVEARVTAIDAERGELLSESALGTLRVKRRDDDAPRIGDRLTLVLKQEDLRICDAGQAPAVVNCCTLPIAREIFVGDRLEVICPMGGAPDSFVSIYASARHPVGGERVSFYCKPDEIHYFHSP
jgi:iron(III) transport system ATP-binding protein